MTSTDGRATHGATGNEKHPSHDESISDAWAGTASFPTTTRRPLDGSARHARLPHWVRSPVAHLVPLRVFIGIGWLRAWLEKATDGAWYNGDAVRAFVARQVADGAVLSDGYEWLMQALWEPLAMPVGWVVMVAEVAVGLGVLLGIWFNTALSIGLFLNLQFIAAGVVSPSAFYMVIQTALLGSSVGEIMSIDGWRHARSGRWLRSRWYFAAAAAWTAVAVWAGSHADELGAGAVSDPGSVLAFDAVLAASATLMVALRRRALGGP